MRASLAKLREQANMPPRPPLDSTDWDGEDTEVTLRRGKDGDVEFVARIPGNVKIAGIIVAAITGIGGILGALRATGIWK